MKTEFHRYLLAYLLALPIAIAAALLQPIWNPIDEAAHFDLIAQYAHGVPAAVSTPMRPETVALMRAHGVNPGVQLAMPARDFVSPPIGVSGSGSDVWLYRHIWQYSNEAFEPPVFYLVAVPFWLAGDALAGPAGALYAVRLLNALLVALLAPITFALAARLLPTSRSAPWLAAALAAVVPGSVYSGTHVTNDTLATVGGSGLLLLAVWRLAIGWGWGGSLLAGVLLGLAFLVKPTTAGIGLAIVLSILIAPATGVIHRLGHLLLAVAAGGSTVLPWLGANRLLFGGLTQFREPQSMNAFGNHLVPPQPADALQQFQQLLAFGFDFWGWGLFALVMVAFSLLALPGIARLLVDRADGGDRAVLAICLAGVAGQATFAFIVPFVVGSGSPSPGRYLYPAAAGAFALLVAGWWRYRLPRAVAILLVGLVALSLAVSLPGSALGNGGRPVSRFGQPAASASSIALRGEGSANGLTVQVDGARYDAAAQGLWLHLVATQSPAGSVEWTPTPRLILDGSAVAAERVSYGFTADTLAPGGGEAGWVAVAIDRRRLDAAQSIVVSFPDVADLGYRQVSDLRVHLSR